MRIIHGLQSRCNPRHWKMKKIIIVPIFLIVTLSVFSQNSSEIASLIKAAQDSMQNKKYKVAWRIFDGCAAISDDTATIASLQSTLYKKAIDDGFEAYRQRQFDMAVMYYSDVAVDDTALVYGPYWVSNAKRMKLLNKVNGVVHMSALTTMLASAVNDTYLTSVDEYESLFKNTVNILCENMNKKRQKRECAVFACSSGCRYNEVGVRRSRADNIDSL